MVDLYQQLPPKLKFTSDAPFTPQYIQSNTKNEDIYRNRVLGRSILLDNPVRVSRAKKLKQLNLERREREREKTKERLHLGRWGRLCDLEPSQRRYELFLPLHQLWMGYMSELLGLPSFSSSSAHPKLVKADYHGSIITVKQAKNPSLVGLQGIVIHETENAFLIITKCNKQKLLPKQNSIFTFPVPLNSTLPNPTALDGPHMLFTLYGNQFRFRAADRAGRKFKPKVSIEL